tara:strand:+ start:331 stop:552 length:222 start_codon:yes stop_codon:yes gene_type:complete
MSGIVHDPEMIAEIMEILKKENRGVLADYILYLSQKILLSENFSTDESSEESFGEESSGEDFTETDDGFFSIE